ncbi:MAG TPA: CopD family protein [Steroidobacteraceae bacterium]|nr:CopD family protein [Steroidobacteraceae bacterium]
MGLWDGCAVLVKALLYASTLGAAGGVGFLAYAPSLLEHTARRSIARLLLVLILAALLASAARVLVTAGSLSGDASGMLDAGLLRLVWHGGEGRAALIRAAGLVLAIPALARRGRPGWLALLGAAAAATSFAWIGHTRAVGWRTLPWLLAVHLLAAAFWLGALAPLLIQARRAQSGAIAAVAARFSGAAVFAVGALLAAGLIVLAVLLPRPSALWSSLYGRIAGLKIALVACLLALAALNKQRLVPRIATGDRGAVRRLRQSIGAEMMVAALILLVTAALTTLTGPPNLD